MAYVRERDRVPAAPIRRVVEEWLSRAAEAEGEGAVDRLAELVWGKGSSNGERYLWSLRNNQQEYIAFDAADKILCRTDNVMLWRTDPELAPVYAALDLTTLDLVEPTCATIALKTRAEITGAFKRLGSVSAVSSLFGVSRKFVNRVIAEGAAC